MKNALKSINKGFTLIELIIAIAILSFGAVALYSMLATFIGLASDEPLRLTGSYLAQEGLAIVKNIRDYNFINRPEPQWDNGLRTCSGGCQADYKAGTTAQTSANRLKTYEDTFLSLNSEGFYSYDAGGNLSLFKRKITIVRMMANNALKVDVVVTWNHRGKAFSASAHEYLYNWH